MFLAYLLFSSFSFNLDLARRSKTITFNGKSNIRPRSAESSWYFVKLNFLEEDGSLFISKIMNELKEQGIYFESSNCIAKNVYNVFLTPSQVNFIISNDYGEVQELQSENKIINTPDFDWSLLTVEASDSKALINEYNAKFSADVCKFKFTFTTKRTFQVYGEKECLISLINYLIEDKRIYAVSYSKEPEVLNTRAAGFAQKNTDQAKVVNSEIDGSHVIDVDRFLNKQGLDGTGVTVLVSDTYLDTNSTFFYDPNCPNIELNKIITNHRKICYISAQGNETRNDNEHGTHVAGSVAGRALNDTSAIAKYNGGAYGSKLAFYASNNQNFNIQLITETVDIVKPHLSTNSWGLDRDTVSHDKSWDEVALARTDTLFIFAAGNSGKSLKPEQDHFQTLRSPGSAKNILTVGAVEAVAIDEKSLPPNSKDIYLLDGEGKLTLTKVLDWSISDLESNVGLKNLFNAVNLKIQTTRETSNLKENNVLIIDSKEEFDNLPKDNPPYYVITTSEFTIDDFSKRGFKHTFPVIYMENSSLPKFATNDLYANYRTNKTYFRADFSSQGTGNMGIMKPDIMCPGVSIFSAASRVDSPVNHEELAVKFGTSMATPTCAGASALLYQYFLEGKYRNKKMNISAQLARSFLINSADPLVTIHPNAMNGFGVLNLGNYIGNGDDVDNNHLLVGEHIKINEEHLEATVTLTKSTNIDFRVTISYLDATFSSDSSAALAADLDLVVVSPSGKVYRGNQREDGTEEHYSTNEKVIINASEIEDGDYEIHVLSSVPKNHANELRNLVEFAITLYGPLDKNRNKDFIQFEKAKKCIPLDGQYNGQCNEETKLNECSMNRFGRSCQTEGREFFPDIPREVYKAAAYGVIYVALKNPFSKGTPTTYRVTPASVFEPKIAAFLGTDQAGMEIEADSISTMGGFITTSGPDTQDAENHALLMIYNPSPYPVDFVISAETSSETSEPTRPGPVTSVPTSEPTIPPTSEPTSEPIIPPTSEPTSVPTSAPSSVPTFVPSRVPTSVPSSDSNSNEETVSKKSFLIVSIMTIVFGVIMIVLAIVLIVILLKTRRPDQNSSSAMISISKSLL